MRGSCLAQALQSSLKQHVDPLRGIGNGLVHENLLGQGIVWILIEIAAEGKHQVNVFADVAFRNDGIGLGAGDAVVNRFTQLGVAQHLTLGLEELVEMNYHAVFEALQRRLGKRVELFLADIEHGGVPQKTRTDLLANPWDSISSSLLLRDLSP